MSYLKNYRWLMLLLVSVSLILAPGFANDAYARMGGGMHGGMHGDDDCVPDPVMISLSTLNDWINTGLAIEAAGGDFSKGYNNGVEDSCGYKKMAILSVQRADDYNMVPHTNPIRGNGHPSHAYLWDRATELRADRSDGIIATIFNHPTQAMMDVILHRADINKKRVIVLTGDDLKQIGIAYSQLRYWGFPKAQLRVANGVLYDFPGTLTAVAPADAGNDYSVCDQEKNFKIDETRATLAEMMSVATDSDPNTVVLDVRTSAEYNGTANKKTAFSGRIKTAVWNEWKNQTTTNSSTAAGSQIKSKADLEVIMASVGITGNETSYIY